ncbi:Spore photoproduct lyase [hydrothermal vent metagenome]|uniref:Spore photoproduct lyase n=1 Tax=hydrothermal vent metagenome TaxID=652676 RepID=A0A1W1D3K1_9ZZZZ
MIFIVTALKPEAQAFVDKYKLKKNTLKNYTIFQNDTMTVIISGIGIHNAMMATQTLIDFFDIVDEDIFLNVGICGANKQYEIGSLLPISHIIYEEKKYSINTQNNHTIACVNTPITNPIYEIVDMESFGFYDAIIHSPAIKNYAIFKIVSDHFEPKKITKETTKSLLFQHIETILSSI